MVRYFSSRDRNTLFGWILGLIVFLFCLPSVWAAATTRPNILLVMTDDQGWGDTGYNGHKHLRTPVMDEIARTGIRFDRFYAAAPVCSPTRGSVLTGRHPNRYGCFLYNWAMRPEEWTLAEILRDAGYATGHFGKWHLGPVRAGTPVNPGGSGFEEWLSHDNFFDLDPALSRNGAAPRIHAGESSQIVATAALDFMDRVQTAGRPFLAVVWLGSPHRPHESLRADREAYSLLSEDMQDYLGEIVAVDRALGFLRDGLRERGLRDNTVLWFCSDNGPRKPGSTGGLRGHKGELWEGGIRVPGLLEWPGRLREPLRLQTPCVTSDMLPTLLDYLELPLPEGAPALDGISLRPLLEGQTRERGRGIGFWQYPRREENEKRNGPWLPRGALQGFWRDFDNYRHPVARSADFGGHAVWMEDRFKLHLTDRGMELYDLLTDPGEKRNLVRQQRRQAELMKESLLIWQLSVERSLSGADYAASPADVEMP